jgi:hypothetical protein
LGRALVGLFQSVLVLSAMTPTLAQNELCDGRDNDADGSFDEACPSTCTDMQSPGTERLLSATSAQALIGRDRSAVWDGTRLAVVWTNQPIGQDHTITLRRFDLSGQPVGGELPIFIGPVEADPAIAWSGSGYGIVWSDEDFGLPRILFAHVDAQGQLTTPATQVNTVDQDGTRPTIAWNGSEFIVAWSWYNSRLHTRRITSAGTKLGSETCLNCAGPSGTGEISIAVAHTDLVGYAYSDLHGSMMFVQTTKTLTPAGGPINFASLMGTDQPSLVWDGSAWAVTWFDRRQANEGIYFNRISTTPAELLADDVRINAVEPYSSSPSMAWTGSEYIVGWIGGPGPPWKILTRRVSATGTPLGTTQYYGIGNYNRCRTTMVWTGSRPIFVRDEDEFSTTSPIRARLFDCCSDSDADGVSWCAGDTDDRDFAIYPSAGELCDGRDNDGDAMLDESGCDRDCAQAPYARDGEFGSTAGVRGVLAIRGGETFVSHVESSLPGFQLALDRGGPPWSRQPLESDSASSDQLTTTWAGDRTITVWRDLRGGSSQLRGSAIDRFGTALWVDQPIVTDAGNIEQPQVVWGTRRALLAYLQGSPAALRYTLLTPEGSRLLDGVRLDTGNLSTAVEYAAARDPRGGFVVIWIEPQGVGSTKSLRVVRLSDEGSIVVGPIELLATPLPLNTPRIVPIATGFLVLWNGPDSGNLQRAMRRSLDPSLQPISVAAPFSATGTLLSGLESLVWTGAEIVMITPGTGSNLYPLRWRFDEAGNNLDTGVLIGSDPEVRATDARWDGTGIRTLSTVGVYPPGTGHYATGRIDCALSVPGLVDRLLVSRSAALDFSWNPADGASLYDLASGPIGASADRCDLDNISATNASIPIPTGQRFFLVRANGGSWDDRSSARALPRSVSACP